MDLRKLEYFYVVASEGSLSKAAEKLTYAQSNLSTMIRKLEEEVDAQLFYRSSQGMQLTEKGKELFRYADEMLQMSQRISRAMKTSSSQSIIHLGTLESIAVTILPGILSAYNNDHPNNKVQVEIRPSFGLDGLVEKILTYEKDLAFISGDLDDAEIQVQKIGIDHAVLVSNRDYGENVPYEEMLNDQILSFPVGCCCRIRYDAFAAHMRIKPKEILETASISTIFSNVIAGMGVACFPKSCVRFYETSFPVYVYELPDPFSEMEWSIIWRKDSYLSKPMKDLIRLAKAGGPYLDGIPVKSVKAI